MVVAFFLLCSCKGFGCCVLVLTLLEIKVLSLPISLSRDALNLFREVAFTVFADKALHVRATLFVKNVAHGVQLRVSSGLMAWAHSRVSI